jgi:dGTPase
MVETPLLRRRRELNERDADILSARAARSTDAIRRRADGLVESGHRQNFFLDADRVLHSHAYTRYIDKTQVFYLVDHDHITHRVLHVQFLAKIARDIGRFLGLNEDLIEAIALGHDIGHCPFGHDGERFLSAICERHGIGHFLHNVQSVHVLERVERKGRGWNLSLQTLDGILCHDGEVHDASLSPRADKTFEQLDGEMEQKRREPKSELRPMTLEGCVVRLADTISYIGRDIEDAVRLGLITREQIPASCADRLGTTNGAIVFNLVEDIIQTSEGKDGIGFSAEVSDELRELKRFNYEHIYTSAVVKREVRKIERAFENLFAIYLEDLESGNDESALFRGFLDGMAEEYTREFSPAEIVRDYISGMTDDYFMKRCADRFLPQRMVGRFDSSQ